LVQKKKKKELIEFIERMKINKFKIRQLHSQNSNQEMQKIRIFKSDSFPMLSLKQLANKVIESPTLKNVFFFPEKKNLETKKLFSFQSQKDLENWYILTDEEFGGKSTASLRLGEEGQAIFEGNISLELSNDSRQFFTTKTVRRTGFAALMTKQKFDLKNYDAIEYYVKGVSNFSFFFRN